MSERPSIEYPPIPHEELLRNAERLFAEIPFEASLVLPTTKFIAGKVAPEVEDAIRAEYERAQHTEYERRMQREAEWKQRSIGKIVVDALNKQHYAQYVSGHEPQPAISEVINMVRRIDGSLPLGNGWPQLPISVTESYLEGALVVADQEFQLDPAARTLRISMGYPLSDGTRLDLGVTHTLYPYREQIETSSHVVFGDYWRGIPHQPFTDTPADSSVYMNQALKMLTDSEGYSYSGESALRLTHESRVDAVDIMTFLPEQVQISSHPEIQEASRALTEILKHTDTVDKEQLSLAWSEYGRIVEEVVDSIEESSEDPLARAKAQIAAIINKAHIFQLAGNTLRYLGELDDAYTYAFNIGLDELSDALASEITRESELQPLSPEILIIKMRGIIDESNREFLKDLVADGTDMEDMLGHVYGMILEQGDDPDQILANLGITE